jgi:GT2 family glycosyltransferase/glycosyltransferase involved in cell wall biosynthesis
VKILFVVHGFPPRALGGTEIHTRALARSLQRDCGHEVAVLTRDADPQVAEFSVTAQMQDGLQLFAINNTFSGFRSFGETYRAPRIADAAMNVIRRVAPDVVHLQHLTCLSTELPFRLRKAGIPTIATLHDYWLLCHRGQLFDVDHRACDGPHVGCGRCIRPHAGFGAGAYRAASLVRGIERRLPQSLARVVGRTARDAAHGVAGLDAAERHGRRRRLHMLRALGAVDEILAPSDTLVDRFVASAVPRDRIQRITLGIDQKPLEGVERTASDRLRIGFLGSLIVSKAPHVLLEAFAGLKPESARLEIFGGIGDYHGDDGYRRVVEPLMDGPGITVHGAVPHERLAEVFAAIDVLVMPSTWIENAPLVIREAFTAGVPVVASDLGGMAEMVEDGVSGLLFEPGNVDALRRQLQRLVDDPGLLSSLKRGLPEARSIEDFAAEMERRYLDLVARPPRESRCLAAVVLNYRTPREAVLAVRSLERGRRPPDEIVVVDNGSGDDSEEVLQRLLPGRRVIPSTANLGFSGGMNLGIRCALSLGADAVLLVNSDVQLGHEAVSLLERALEDDPQVGIASPLVLHREAPDRIASAGLHFSRLTGRMRHRDHGQQRRGGAGIHRVPAIMACAPLIRAEALEAVGGFDDDYFFSFEDLDFCLRAGAEGFASVVVEAAAAYHAGSLSIGATSPARLYYAARNHMVAADRAAPVPWPVSWMRRGAILALNAGHGLRCGWVEPRAALGAVARGFADGVRGRMGAMP